MAIIRFIAVTLALTLAVAARAETIVGTTTPAADGAALFVAKEEGIFAKHGLDVKIQMATLMPNLPAMMASGSAQFGLITPTTVIQAVDGGLDMVAISGASVLTAERSNQTLVARTGAGIKTAADFVGKRVGVPGFGASLHVVTLFWLELKGVDPKQVHFVEVPFPQMKDLLAAGQIDAVIAIDPVLTQIISSNTGYVVADLVPDLPAHSPALIVAAMRAWTTAHPADAKALQAALAEAEAFVNDHPDKALADDAVYIKMPPELLKRLKIGLQDPVLTPQQMQWWVDVMKRNAMLSGPVDPAKLILAR